MYIFEFDLWRIEQIVALDAHFVYSVKAQWRSLKQNPWSFCFDTVQPIKKACFEKASSLDTSPDIILCGWLGLKHQLTNFFKHQPWYNLLWLTGLKAPTN